MKITLFQRRSSLFLILASLFLFSCAGVRQFNSDLQSSRDKDRKYFVELLDGTILEGDEVVLRSPLIGKNTIQVDKDTRIPAKEVMAYQNKYGYYRNITNEFVPRVKKGLINLYMKTVYYTEFQASGMGRPGGTRQRVRYVYYLQKGDKAPVVPYEVATLRDYVKDYPPALEYMTAYDQTKKKVKRWSLINTGATLGGIAIAGMNPQNDATLYGGFGLFVGGIANGFVNKFRKGKNYQNLQLALDEYNRQESRMRKTKK